MNRKTFLKSLFIMASLFTPSLQSCILAENHVDSEVFRVVTPDYQKSPLTGVTRQHWVDAATYLLDGAFSYIHTLDDPMKFPKQHDKTYPKNEGQVPTEKLEGLCRTLFLAAPLLRENSELTLHGIKVADYYRHQLLNLINPESPSFIKHRAPNGGASQILVEFGALAISLSVVPEVLWEPLTQEQKDALAATMISYGDGPTVNSNWRFFNIFVLSFFKDKGYAINEARLVENLDKALAFYRGEGWYNDSPAYDYYSMWAFQMYGPLWAQLYGKFYPQHAARFVSNLNDMTPNYPYMFNRDGRMNMWGRSITYRFGAVIPFAMLGFQNRADVNYGWLRRIASSTMLQFLQHPQFLEDQVPTLGFYGPFAPAVQIYSCRGSVYWCGKAFLSLLLPKDNIFWTATENNGPWENELKKGQVYNKFQPGSELMITDYPNSGAAEMRSWCHETVAGDWQLFRSTENYNKLAYNTEFPWMADGPNGEISMNYGIKNQKDKWEVLRLYTFKKYEQGIYYRDAVLETNKDIQFKLADITLPDGILRVDKVSSPVTTDLRLGHYSLPQLGDAVTTTVRKVGKRTAFIVSNGEFQMAMVPVEGWKGCEFIQPSGLHPVSEKCALPIASNTLEAGKEKVLITLMLWKKGTKPFTDKELFPLKQVSVKDGAVKVTRTDNTVQNITW